MRDPVVEVARYLEQWTGIIVPPYRFPLLAAELGRLGGEHGVMAGYEMVRDAVPGAREAMLQVAAIGETYFFRHPAHYELLTDYGRHRQSLGLGTRVLSAGCSTGEEAWSAAAVLANVYGIGSTAFEVTGWDIHLPNIQKAKTAQYKPWAARHGLGIYEKFFEQKNDLWLPQASLRKKVGFRRANLTRRMPPADSASTQTPSFDIIFFRNVSIYWEMPVTERVLAWLTSLLSPQGMLFVGPSDHVRLGEAEWHYHDRRHCRAYVRRSAGLPFIDISRQSRSTEKNAARRLQGANDDKKTRPQPPRLKPAQRTRTTAAKIRDKAPTPAPVPRSKTQEAPKVQAAKDAPAVAHIGLAEVQAVANAGDSDRALALLRSLQGPGHAGHDPTEVKHWETILLLSLGRNDEAVAAARQCVFLEPEEPTFRGWLAMALEAAGKSHEAAKEFANLREMEKGPDGDE